MPLASVLQIDLTPTVALLMGIPIPKNNLGTLLPQLFPSGTKLTQDLHKY